MPFLQQYKSLNTLEMNFNKKYEESCKTVSKDRKRLKHGEMCFVLK